MINNRRCSCHCMFTITEMFNVTAGSIFLGISHCCSSTAIIATNTLKLDINTVVERTSYKEVMLWIIMITIRILLSVKQYTFHKSRYSCWRSIFICLSLFKYLVIIIGLREVFQFMQWTLILAKTDQIFRKDHC